MSLARLLRIRRDVRLGGVRVGPLRLGGHVYTIGPLSVLRLMQFSEAVHTISERLGESASVLIATDLRTFWSSLLPLFTDQPIHPRDLANAWPEQIAAAIAAIGECNDLTYLVEQITPRDDSETESVPLHELVFRVARHYRVTYPPDVLGWPAAVFFAALDAMAAEAAQRPPGTDPVTDDDRLRVSTYARMAGLF